MRRRSASASTSPAHLRSQPGREEAHPHRHRQVEQLTDASRAQVFSDVDSAYAQVESNIALLKPYKEKYLAQSTRVRDTVTFAYQRGGASLMDFLNAQSDYRVVQLAYLQLIGTYLTAASQLNMAVGREVIP
jgi:cobalt-zinc-cadmium efflux system outer membrane protein